MTSREERLRLAERARSTLGAWRFRIDDPHFDGALERLVYEPALEKRDARVLDRVLRHLEWLKEEGDA